MADEIIGTDTRSNEEVLELHDMTHLTVDALRCAPSIVDCLRSKYDASPWSQSLASMKFDICHVPRTEPWVDVGLFTTRVAVLDCRWVQDTSCDGDQARTYFETKLCLIRVSFIVDNI
jgi:hypothetical protein